MSTVTIAFAVDVDRLTAMKGCGDEELLKTVERTCGDSLSRMESPAEPGKLSVRDALRHIVVDGETPDASAAAQYVYALELLCRHLGKPLDGTGHIGHLDDLD